MEGQVKLAEQTGTSKCRMQESGDQQSRMDCLVGRGQGREFIELRLDARPFHRSPSFYPLS